MFEDTETEGTSLELAMLPVSLTPDICIWITVVHMLHASIMACALRTAMHYCQQANLNHLCNL